MALYLASYDIPEKDRDEYKELWAYFDSLKAIKILFSEYAVPYSGKAMELTNAILQHMRAGDRLLVCELFDGGTLAWRTLLISDDTFRKLLTSYARTLN